MNGLTYIKSFIAHSEFIFNYLLQNIEWDERMKARLTASFGAAYNYSQISYPFRKMPVEIENLCEKINSEFNFTPNNCLINLYPNGDSRMGFHSDQTDILAENTGIAIISLGETRLLKFRKITNHLETYEFQLDSGSLVYMTQELQEIWQHSIPKSNNKDARMSLTFRQTK